MAIKMLFFGRFADQVEPKGSLALRSKDLTVPPVIDSSYLSDSAGLDEKHLWYGFQEVREIVSRKPFAAVFTEQFPMAFLDIESKGAFGDLLDGVALSDLKKIEVNHFTGGCRLGQVLGVDLVVKGTTDLSAGDASAIPVSTSVNTQFIAMLMVDNHEHAFLQS